MSEKEAHEIVEDFYGVYLLLCFNPQYKGRTYIGFTVDPNRRINQHNKGKAAGGAWRTSNKGPWEMVLIVHGFPNEISALRFEWAWQHPDRSRRLQHLTARKKKAKESRFEFSFRIVSEMLRVGPWNRLPLTIQWLKPEHAQEFLANKLPPAHMPIQCGSVKSKQVNPEFVRLDEEIRDEMLCQLCKKTDSDVVLRCLNKECDKMSHMACLAKHFLADMPHLLLPLEGKCPNCQRCMRWGDLIRKKRGCYQDDIGDSHWADCLMQT